MKVAILGGGGGVGSSIAFNLLLGSEPHDIVLVDSREEMITSHVMDLEQVLELGGAGSVRRGGLGDLLDAQVVVLTASAPLTVNSSRLEYLTANADVLAGVVDVLEQNAAWPGVLIVVTNPVDPLCTWIERRTGIDRARVLGYTLNDSLRLRTGIARVLGVGRGAVEAWVVGEHGDACVPLFDRVRVAGEAIELTPEQRTEADSFLRTWYVRHVALDSGRSSTWTSGVGVARMVSAIAADERELWPASVVLRGEYGVEGVALSVPTLLGRDGASIEEWALAPDDQAAFELAAVRVGEAARRIEARDAGARPPRLAPDLLGGPDDLAKLRDLVPGTDGSRIGHGLGGLPGQTRSRPT